MRGYDAHVNDILRIIINNRYTFVKKKKKDNCNVALIMVIIII